MKKSFAILLLLLLFPISAFAKNSDNSNQQQNNQQIDQVKIVSTTQSRVQDPTTTPTGNQVKNQNQTQIQNEGEAQQLSVQPQENEQLSQNLDDSLQKVSNQVHNLIDTVGAKGGIGQQVSDIAQNQTKIQDQIKSSVSQLASRSAVSKFFIGSDKKAVKQMEQQKEQNQLLIQQLEELKTKTTNNNDLDQIQQTIDLMTYQNSSLQETIDSELKVNGLFGWLVNLFNR